MRRGAHKRAVIQSSVVVSRAAHTRRKKRAHTYTFIRVNVLSHTMCFNCRRRTNFECGGGASNGPDARRVSNIMYKMFMFYTYDNICSISGHISGQAHPRGQTHESYSEPGTGEMIMRLFLSPMVQGLYTKTDC
jgi:hypothetical protein